MGRKRKKILWVDDDDDDDDDVKGGYQGELTCRAESDSTGAAVSSIEREREREVLPPPSICQTPSSFPLCFYFQRISFPPFPADCPSFSL